MESAKTPAQVYEEVFVPAIFMPCTRQLLDVARPRPGERVLDLACGTGVVARMVAPLVGSEGRVAGLDLRPGMLAVASSLPAPEGAPVEWVEGDALALPFEDGTFDLVLCQQGIQFFPDQTKAMSEMCRVLAPGGRAGLAVWRGFDRNEFFGAMTEVEMRHLADLGMTYEDLAQPFLFGDPEWLHGLLAGAGFGAVDVEPRSLEARFPADGFVENAEFAYSAVVPEFVDDPGAFAAFVDVVDQEMAELVARHRDGDEIAFPLHLNVAAATA
ncbi:MAG: methyltransferase domain-containing protein [Thermoleophilia bacterium]|nr:methyltransferase domain-containing protein [Thermoleophilia bacterium]